VDLIRDVLDQQIVDRNQRRLGKVDGIVIELREGKPPVVLYLESGWVAKLRRIHGRIGSWAGRRLRAPYRIPWKSVRDVGVDLEIAEEAAETPLLRTELRLRRILSKAPGA